MHMTPVGVPAQVMLLVGARLWSCADTKRCRESLLRGRGSSLDLSSQTGAMRSLLSALKISALTVRYNWC